MTFTLFRVEMAHLFCYAVTSWELHDVVEVKALHLSNRGTIEGLSQNTEIKIWKNVFNCQEMHCLEHWLITLAEYLAMSAPKYSLRFYIVPCVVM